MEPSISVDQDLCRGGSSFDCAQPFDCAQDATGPDRTRSHPALPQPQSEAGFAIPGLGAGAGRLYLLIAPHPAVDRLMDALAVRLALAADASAHQFQQSTPPLSASSVYLHLLDSGNRFDLHGIARGIARGGSRGGSASITAALPPKCPDWTRPAPTVEAILQRIRVARAFTCYQAEALLAGVAGAHEMRLSRGGSACAKPVCLDEPRPAPTADPPATILAPSLLAPFADENVPRGERLRLLGRCIQHLKRLAASAPVLVSAAPPAGVSIANAEVAEFLARLEAAADQIWRFESGVVVGVGLRPAPTRPAPTDGQLRMF